MSAPTLQPQRPKSIAVIGAGSAGLAALRNLLEIQDPHTPPWEVVLYEQRHDVGGIWLQDEYTNSTYPVFPNLPETPLYPLLHTNTPTPAMTYPGYLFQPNTPLYPSHEHIQLYHSRFADKFGLRRHIRFNHSVDRTQWVGDHWSVDVNHEGKVVKRQFDHLVVASGHNQFPVVPTFRAQEDWLKSGKRRIFHSIYYRDPKEFEGRVVVVVGGGASGRDSATQLSRTAAKTYYSVRHATDDVTGNVVPKPEISHFTETHIFFEDGTSCQDADTVVLGTGYEYRVPFLEKGGVLETKPGSHARGDGLTTNLRYIFPLHDHTFSLSSAFPTTALSFVGLPIYVANCASDHIQSLYIAHAIKNATLLPSREELLARLDSQEETSRSWGDDPYHIGHRMLHGLSNDSQDELYANLQKWGAIPDDGKRYVEQWRRDVFTWGYLKRGWKRIDALGEQGKWLDGVESEQEWVRVMREINEWQKEYEDARGVVFVDDVASS